MMINSYKNEFKQAVLTIISNAKDAILDRRKRGLMRKGEEGLIGIGFSLDGETVKITMSDNGGGIPQKIMDRIFEPYFTTKKKGEGIGIGLYMAHVIIEKKLGGKLYSESIKNGAMFTIEIRKEEKNGSGGNQSW